MKNRKLICNIIITFLLVLLIIPVCKIITIDSNAANDGNSENTKNNLEKAKLSIATEEQLKNMGDLDANGKVDSYDAYLVLQYISEGLLKDVTDYDYAIKYLDSNKDGKITIRDAKYILCYTVSGNDVTSSKTFEEFMADFDKIYIITEDGDLIKR